MTPEESAHMDTVHVATDDGHSNPRSFCVDLSDVDNMADDELAALTAYKTCVVDRDLAAAAQTLYDADPEKDAQAKLCFMEGLCTMTNVTNNMSVEETEAICDAKYGHETWTTLKMKTDLADFGASGRDARMAIVADEATYRSRAFTSTMGQLMCAGGQFQCLTVTCRDHYCKNEELVKKYGHYLKEYGYTP